MILASIAELSIVFINIEKLNDFHYKNYFFKFFNVLCLFVSWFFIRVIYFTYICMLVVYPELLDIVILSRDFSYFYKFIMIWIFFGSVFI